MSLHISPGMARLTVIGTGWSNTSIDSGDGTTSDGLTWKDISSNLGYEYGDNVDWDAIIGIDGSPDINWKDAIYITPDGTIYTDSDGDGTFTDPSTGLEYPGGGNLYLPESNLMDIADSLENIANENEDLMKYDLTGVKISYSGKTSTPSLKDNDTDNVVRFKPAAYYATPYGPSTNDNVQNSIYFSDATFEAYEEGDEADGWNATATAFTYQGKTIYSMGDSASGGGGSSGLPAIWGNHFGSYNGGANKLTSYMAWQLLYGTFKNGLVIKGKNTITKDKIKNGTSGLPKTIYAGGTYYMCTK